MEQAVLVIGASRMLGSRIVHHLLSVPNTSVGLLALKNSPRTTVAALIECGAELAEGDLAEHTSLTCATTGIDVVISKVQGGSDVIIEGQLALLDAARSNDGRRFLPSDFALDLF